jgi:glucan phosphoethanolaminetransferase (alkaline phosphatase superfamily)
MWDFARLAGFKTVLIDAHSPPATLFHSYMSGHEARSIDSIRTETVTPWYNRDHAIPATLLELLQSPQPMLIAVNKFGTHTNYNDAMPPGFTYETKRDDSGSKLDPERRSIVSTYDKALRWSVDGFFKRILPQAIRDDVLIIYTSDHGQALFDGGYDTQHCGLGTRVADGESYVPLFAVTGSKPFLADLQREADRSFNRASHFEIFPTILMAMGYDSSWSTQRYGPSLFNVPHDRKRGFLIGGFYSPTAKWQMLGTNAEFGQD